MTFSHSIGLVGATGAVGRKFLQVLNEQGIVPKSLRLFASEKSKGSKIAFQGKEYTVEAVNESDFSGLQVVFFSAGTEISQEYCPKVAKAGAIVIDNSNAFRADPEVPLVVPEVNPNALKKHKGLISNPNCSTIQMLVAIAPIHRINPIKRIVVSTYQSVSGTGIEAIEILEKQTKATLAHEKPPAGVYPHQIGFNLFPHIDIFLKNGLCREEEKMINETRKILEDTNIAICPTTVRVPIFYCHSEAVNLELSKPFELSQVRELLSKSPGIKMMDDPNNNVYPTPLQCQDKDDVFIGRLRRDESLSNGLNMWVVSDNLRRGAASNGVFIYQRLVQDKMI
ncbi:MAG: aspartate-semialdehyde dehydrogenase [Candidatus Riflebacteria bacterium]|nr:aspartate-semialdehyde dehydrogenase [Candidatus Riflebacteria bacterium]